MNPRNLALAYAQSLPIRLGRTVYRPTGKRGRVLADGTPSAEYEAAETPGLRG